jgi:hypothetical protein
MTEKEQRFIINSIRERRLFIKFAEQVKFITTHQITDPAGHEKHDVIASFEQQPYLIELKVRHKPSTYGAYMIEKDKYDYLISKSNELGIRPMYINFFMDNTVVVWDLSEIPEPNWKSSINPKDSQTDEPEQREKEEADLIVSDGYKYQVENLEIMIAYEAAKVEFNLRYLN